MADVNFLKRKYLKKAQRPPKTKLFLDNDGFVQSRGCDGASTEVSTSVSVLSDLDAESLLLSVSKQAPSILGRQHQREQRGGDDLAVQMEAVSFDGYNKYQEEVQRGRIEVIGLEEAEKVSTSPLTGQVMHTPNTHFAPAPGGNTPPPATASFFRQSSSFAAKEEILSTPTRASSGAVDETSLVCRSCEQATSQTKTLNNLLSAQRKANSELKRLLVASVGDDLKSKFSRVAEEKALLSVEVNDMLQQLTKDWEEIERLAIESDLWRSKYVASRFMIEELLQWKTVLVSQLKEEGSLICSVLEERRRVERVLQSSLLCVGHVHSVFSHSLHLPQGHKDPKGSQLDVLMAVESLNAMTKDICGWMGGGTCCHGNYVSNNDVQTTQTEYLCHQSLDRQKDLLVACEQLPILNSAHQLHPPQGENPVIPRLPSLLSTVKAFLSSREDHHKVHLHCRKCKGKVIVV